MYPDHHHRHNRPSHRPPVLVTAPAVEPVDRPETKLACRIDGTTEDTEIDKMITEARLKLEKATARAFITQTWRMTLDWFPHREFELRVCPVQAEGLVIIYIDVNGDEATVDASIYTVDVDSEPARIRPKPGYCWPLTNGSMGAVKVTFQAGYGDTAADVPEDIKRAIKQIVGDAYRYRDISTPRKSGDEMFQKQVRQLAWGAYP